MSKTESNDIRLVFSANKSAINLNNEPYKTNGLIGIMLGRGGSGKSSLLLLLARESYRNKLPFILYDWSGDAVVLRELGGDVLIVGNKDDDVADTMREAHISIRHITFQNARTIMQHVYNENKSLVVDLSSGLPEDKLMWFTMLTTIQYSLAERMRKPVLTLIDEADKYAPRRKMYDGQKESTVALLSMIDGRKYGLLLFCAAQSGLTIIDDILRSTNVRFFGIQHDYREYKAVEPYLPIGVDERKLTSLKPGCVIVKSVNGSREETLIHEETVDLGKTPVVKPHDVIMDGPSEHFIKVYRSQCEIDDFITAFRLQSRNVRDDYRDGLLSFYDWLMGDEPDFERREESDCDTD